MAQVTAYEGLRFTYDATSTTEYGLNHNYLGWTGTDGHSHAGFAVQTFIDRSSLVQLHHSQMPIPSAGNVDVTKLSLIRQTDKTSLEYHYPNRGTYSATICDNGRYVVTASESTPGQSRMTKYQILAPGEQSPWWFDINSDEREPEIEPTHPIDWKLGSSVQNPSIRFPLSGGLNEVRQNEFNTQFSGPISTTIQVPFTDRPSLHIRSMIEGCGLTLNASIVDEPEPHIVVHTQYQVDGRQYDFTYDPRTPRYESGPQPKGENSFQPTAIFGADTDRDKLVPFVQVARRFPIQGQGMRTTRYSEIGPFSTRTLLGHEIPVGVSMPWIGRKGITYRVDSRTKVRQSWDRMRTDYNYSQGDIRIKLGMENTPSGAVINLDHKHPTANITGTFTPESAEMHILGNDYRKRTAHVTLTHHRLNLTEAE